MKNLSMLTKMKHSPLHNYAGVPGLTSWLIGGKGDHGCVRLFECERNHDEAIIPHSHRFDFQCVVLDSEVCNIVFTKKESCDRNRQDVDSFVATDLIYSGSCGQYQKGERRPFFATRSKNEYGPGDTYSMKASEVHSIYFKKGARVLFFEGPQISDTSIILEPFANGEHVPTFKVEPWMFRAPPTPNEQEAPK